MHSHTQKAFIAGGNDTVLLLRHRPQFCGLRELHAGHVIALYVYNAATKKKRKRRDPAAGISSSRPLLGHLPKKGRERLAQDREHATLRFWRRCRCFSGTCLEKTFQSGNNDTYCIYVYQILVKKFNFVL